MYSKETAHKPDAAPIGHERIHPDGYIIRKVSTGSRGWKPVHRLVMAEQLGRPLKSSEIVHHINGNKQDNRPENLQIMTRGEHTLLHVNQKDVVPPKGYLIPEGKWSHQYDACIECGTTEIRHWGKGYCETCYPKVYMAEYRQRPDYYASKREYFQNRRKQTHLTSGKWAMYYDACIECSTTERRHAGKGLCVACSSKVRYHTQKQHNI